MNRTFLGACVIASCLAGCTANVEPPNSKLDFDVAADDAVITASEGLADSASRPTLIGEIVADETVSENFTRSHKYLAWYFDAEAGQTVDVYASGGPSNPDFDTVAILYNATSGGRPSGASLAVNDDVSDDDYSSHITYELSETRRYVVVARRYDRGTSGKVFVSITLSGGTTRVCGTRGADACGDDEFCNFDGNMCGADDTGGSCTEIPTACPRNVSPVCGCDGRTYNNTCNANARGVSVASEGACGSNCPLTGIICTPTCPGSGRMSGGAPCRAGNFNSETCECVPLADCRTTGCGDDGDRCSLCWGTYACIPERAVC